MVFAGLFFLTLQSLVVSLGNEKEKRLINTMRDSGLQMSAYWASWLLNRAVFTIIPVLITVVILYWPFGLVEHADPTVG